jgi:ribose/xylose/arabinose/galactoside ABC-type transport system permease subunit
MSTTQLKKPALASAAPKAQNSQFWLKFFSTVGPLPPLLVLMIALFALSNDRFLQPDNLLSVSQQSVALLLIALGQMLVLVSGGFDLSVGATVALSSVVSATMMQQVYGGQPQFAGQSMIMGLAVSIAVGIAVGVANGVGVAFLKVNPFIVTLATATIIGGLTMVFSGGATVSGLPREYIVHLGSGFTAGIPNLVLATLPLVAIVFIFLKWTTFGRHLYAIGGNALAARTAGIQVRRNLIFTYVICAVLASIAAYLLTARSGSGQPTFGGTFALQSITAAVIGGASLLGGRGGVGGTLLGVAFIMLLGNGMNFMRLDTNMQNIALGLALVLAVLADRFRAAAKSRLIAEGLTS